MKKIFYFLFLILIELNNSFCSSQTKPIRILVITGGHEYNIEKFNQMLASLGDDIKFQVAELPAAYDMFLPENRNKYDVLVFYHMWQTITVEQENKVATVSGWENPWWYCITAFVLSMTGLNTRIL